MRKERNTTRKQHVTIGNHKRWQEVRENNTLEDMRDDSIGLEDMKIDERR